MLRLNFSRCRSYTDISATDKVEAGEILLMDTFWDFTETICFINYLFIYLLYFTLLIFFNQGSVVLSLMVNFVRKTCRASSPLSG